MTMCSLIYLNLSSSTVRQLTVKNTAKVKVSSAQGGKRYPSVHTRPSIHPSVHPSIHPSIHPYIHILTFLTVSVSGYRPRPQNFPLKSSWSRDQIIAPPRRRLINHATCNISPTMSFIVINMRYTLIIDSPSPDVIEIN